MTRATLPPNLRSRAAIGLTAAAASGRFELQVCARCGAVQYPAREMCHRCLGGPLRWQAQAGAGELLAETTLSHSNDAYFQQRLPWRLGLVRLEVGPTVIVHLHATCSAAPSRVRVWARLDKSGQGVLFASSQSQELDMITDPRLKELSCEPKGMRVLVTDGNTAVGQALIELLCAAGTETIWAGSSSASRSVADAGGHDIPPQVVPVSLDVTDDLSVKALAAQIGHDVDILINTAATHLSAPQTSDSHPTDIAVARIEMDVYYLGLMRLAQEFGPAMRSRALQSPSRTLAWVNLLSIYALVNHAAHGTVCAAKAAAQSFSQHLRAEMRPTGVRVINLYPGPIDADAHRSSATPKLAPQAVARAILSALRDGIEDAHPGEVAQELFERWKENPRLLEHELSG